MTENCKAQQCLFIPPSAQRFTVSVPESQSMSALHDGGSCILKPAAFSAVSVSSIELHHGQIGCRRKNTSRVRMMTSRHSIKAIPFISDRIRFRQSFYRRIWCFQETGNILLLSILKVLPSLLSQLTLHPRWSSAENAASCTGASTGTTTAARASSGDASAALNPAAPP